MVRGGDFIRALYTNFQATYEVLQKCINKNEIRCFVAVNYWTLVTYELLKL